MSKLSRRGSAWQSYRVAQILAAAEARAIRRQLFGQPEPPFLTMQDAWAWARQQVPPTWDEREARREFEGYLARATDALRATPRPGFWADVQLTGRIAWAKLGPLRAVPAVTDALWRLAHAADRLATLTEWAPDEATLFILTGAVPQVQHRVTASVTRAGVVRLHLTVSPWQVHPVEWARLRLEVARELPQFAREEITLSTVQRRLLDLVAHHGPPPRSQGRGRAAGRTTYWKRLARAWGRIRTGKRPLWNTVWKLYARLPRQLRKDIEKGRG
jgi:hypothetical protein